MKNDPYVMLDPTAEAAPEWPGGESGSRAASPRWTSAGEQADRPADSMNASGMPSAVRATWGTFRSAQSTAWFIFWKMSCFVGISFFFSHAIRDGFRSAVMSDS